MHQMLFPPWAMEVSAVTCVKLKGEYAPTAILLEQLSTTEDDWEILAEYDIVPGGLEVQLEDDWVEQAADTRWRLAPADTLTQGVWRVAEVAWYTGSSALQCSGAIAGADVATVPSAELGAWAQA